MTSIITLLLLFAAFGIYGAISDRAAARARRRARRRTLEALPVHRSQTRTARLAELRRAPRQQRPTRAEPVA